MSGNNLAPPSTNKTGSVSENFSLHIVWVIFRRHWYWIILASILGGCAMFYHAAKQGFVYEKHASVMMREMRKAKDYTADRILSDLGVDTGISNLANEMAIMKSTDLMKEVVKMLKLNISYWKKQDIRELDIYKKSPILADFLDIEESRACTLEITPIDDKTYTLSYPSGSGEPIEVQGRFDTPAVLPFATVSISATPLLTPAYYGVPITVRRTSITAAAKQHRAGLDIIFSPVEGSSILYLHLQSSNPDKATDILDLIISVYNENSRIEKQLAAADTAKFIKARLEESNEELTKVTQKIDKKIDDIEATDPKAVLSADFTSAQGLKANIFELETQLKLVDSLAKSLEATETKFDIIPLNTGLADPGISRQIEQYNAAFLEYQRVAESAGVKNPIRVNLVDRMASTRQAAILSLANYKSYQEVRLDELRKKLEEVEARLDKTFSTDKSLDPLVKEHAIIEELHLMLLKRDQENALAMATAQPSARILESSHGADIPIAPKTFNLILIGTAAGGILCALLFYASYVLDNKVKNKTELMEITSIPVVGELPQLSKKEKRNDSLLIQDSRSIVAEYFHILRNNVETLIPRPDQGGLVILVTSTVPGEGKTLISANLAAAFGKAGKKALLVDGDLRKLSLTRQTGGKGRKGFTNILLDHQEDLDAMLHPIEEAPGVDILYSGPSVPNPVTLLSQPLLAQIFQHLKTKYDAIIIDAPPFGILADTALLGSLADISLYAIRSRMIDKRYFQLVQDFSDSGRLKNMAFVINGIDFKSSSYSYYGYGYGSYRYAYGNDKKGA